MKTGKSDNNSEFFLDDILRTNEPVLLDTSAIGPGDLYEHINSHSVYESLDSELMKIELKAQELFLGVLANTKVVTIPEVTKEIAEFYSKITSQKNYLDEKSHMAKEVTSGKNSLLAKNRESLETLVYNIKKMQELSSISELKIEDSCYKLLTEMIKTAENLFHIKQNTNLRYRSSDRIWRKDTDEKLAAMFYWICLNSQDSENSPAVITGDWDILRLIGISYNAFLDPYLSSCNRYLKEFKSAPLIYMTHPDRIGWARKFSLETAKEKTRERYSSSIKRGILTKMLKPLFERFNNL